MHGWQIHMPLYLNISRLEIYCTAADMKLGILYFICGHPANESRPSSDLTADAPKIQAVIQGGNKTLWKSILNNENDNTPQPLDQWTNSPFIGQQVGNCKSFTLTHYLDDLFAMQRGPRSIPLCIQHHIQLTSLSFQVSQTFHSWVTAISKFDHENPRSRSWVRSKFEVTMWV